MARSVCLVAGPSHTNTCFCTPINLVHYGNLAPLRCLKRLIVRHRVDQYWQLSRSSCNAWKCCVEIFMDTRFCTIGQYEWKVMSLIAPGVRERVKFDAIQISNIAIEGHMLK